MYADSLIKYNYYIENMPTHEIPEIDSEKINKILMLTQNIKSLRGKSTADTTNLLNEINFDYAKTMNGIIFDKHLKRGSELITGSLKLPPQPKKKQAPYYGMISIPKPDWPTKYYNFCANTLISNSQVILALNDIKKECNDVLLKDIYNASVTKTLKVDEFR